MVARDEKPRACPSADRKREDAVQAPNAFGPFFFVKMQYDFRVGVGNESVSLALEFPPQSRKL